MKVFKYIFCLFFNISIIGLYAQTINKKGDFIETDPIGNIYLIDKNEIFKYNNLGKQIARYSDNLIGSISSIDTDNPFKIMVFYKDAGIINILDQYLVPIGNEIDIFETLGIIPSLVCFSKENNYWVYSNTTQILYNVDFKNNINFQTQPLSDFFTNTPFQLIEKYQQVFLVSANRILIFDKYGTYLSSVFLKVPNKIRINSNSISFNHENYLYHYSQKTKTLDSVFISTHTTPNQIIENNNYNIIKTDSEILWIKK